MLTAIQNVGWHCALLVALVCGLAVESDTLRAQDSAGQAREIYQQAAQAIQQGQYASAIAPLERLLREYPEFELKATVQVYLGESYIRSGQPEKGFTVLDQLADLNALDATLVARTRQLKLYAAQAVMQASVKEKKWSIALRWLEIVRSLSSAEKQQQWLKYADDLALKALAEHKETEFGQPEFTALWNSLTRAAPSLQQRRQDLLFALAEWHLGRRNETEALKIYEALSQERSPNTRSVSWAGTLALRRANIYFGQKRYSETKEICAQTKRQYPSSEVALECDFLLVRVSIAQVEFEQAFAHLESILAKTTDSGLRGKALFLQGEIHFMRKKYREAISAYEKVLALGLGEWSANATIQRAKCLELSGQYELALQAYQALTAKAQTESVRQLAGQRIAVLNQAISQQTTTK